MDVFIFEKIACCSTDAYRALLAIPSFARYVRNDKYKRIKKILLNTIVATNYCNNKLHSENDMPAKIYHYKKSDKKKYVWYKNGLVHRDNNLPAVIISSKFHMESRWYQNGMLNRKRGPTVVKKYNIEERKYYHVDGILHNQNGPSVGKYKYKSGFILLEWYIDGKKGHIDGDVSEIIYDDNRTTLRYYDRGHLVGEIKNIEDEPDTENIYSKYHTLIIDYFHNLAYWPTNMKIDISKYGYKNHIGNYLDNYLYYEEYYEH